MSISKSDYLKKYLSESEQKPKRRRKIKKSNVKVPKKCSLIDETIDFKQRDTRAPEDILDGYFIEDKPTIADHIDERPEEIIELEKYRDSDRWKKLKDAGDSSSCDDNQNKSNRSDSDQSPPRRRHDSDSDQSPPRRRLDSDFGQSPPRRRQDSDSDQSPPRRRRGADSDHSSPRRINNDSDSDQSPPRRRNNDSDSDQSPPRRRNKHADSDQSPPRRRNKHADSDQSPPRRRNKHADSDQSPPRRRNHYSDSDQSLPRRRNNNSDSDQSPPRRKNGKQSERNKSNSISKKNKPMLATKTLSGQKAGLSSAKEMKFEAMKIRKKNEEAFNKMDDTTMGKNVATVFRDKKTGIKRDLKAENELQREEDEKIEKKKSKYKDWSSGLVQNKRREQALQEDAQVANEPLARYRDDAAMHDFMKDRERDGDPMAAYISLSKKKEKKKLNIKELPKYSGPQGKPNRYKIYPGYRWDGVHRSIGFEEKIFINQGNQMATAEAKHKWSTENM